MQGPSTFFTILTIPFGAGPGTPRMVFNGLTGEIDIYGHTSNPLIVISSALDAMFFYAGT